MKPPVDPLAAHNARMNAAADAAWHRANPPVGQFVMPHVNQMLTSRYLSKHDLPQPVIAHVRGVAQEQARPNEDPKWLMYFNEIRKPMKLNNTILRYLAETLGPSSDTWVGKKVRIYVDHSIMMAGQVVGGVRLQVAKSAALAPAQVSQQFYAGAGGHQPPGPGGPVFAGNATINVPTAGAGAPPAGVDPATGEMQIPADPDFDDDIPF